VSAIRARWLRADEMPEWWETPAIEATEAAEADLAAAREWLDESVTVHDVTCPGQCSGKCLSEDEASREDE